MTTKATIRSKVSTYGREHRRWWTYVVEPTTNVRTRGITRTHADALAAVCRVLREWDR